MTYLIIDPKQIVERYNEDQEAQLKAQASLLSLPSSQGDAESEVEA